MHAFYQLNYAPIFELCSRILLMANLDTDIREILERNKRVEMDKAWEISLTRRAFISLFTYATTAALFWVNGLSNPLLQALIPAVAYLISTLSLPWMKRCWMKEK